MMSHQAAALKADFLERLMDALVQPDPGPYRPLLRRLAALTGGVMCLAPTAISGSLAGHRTLRCLHATLLHWVATARTCRAPVEGARDHEHERANDPRRSP